MRLFNIVENTKGKFYPHDMEQARSEAQARMKQAGGDLGKAQLLHLKDIAERGLPDVYDSFVDFLYDFYPNFSWTPEESASEIEYVLSHPDFPKIADKIKRDWGFDIEENLRTSISED